MIDEQSEFDGVIIGAGHNSLILAAYLARLGLKIVVVESKPIVGGATSTVESNLHPNYYHNLHATILRAIPELPWYTDLELWRYGLKFILPPVNNAVPLSDGRSLILHKDLDITLKSISRFSQKDADAYAHIHDKYSEIARKIIFPEFYSPPLHEEERLTLLQKSRLGRDYLEIDRRSAKDLINELFESEVVKAYALFMQWVRPYNLDQEGTGFSVPAVTYLSGRGHIAVGGTRSLAFALHSAVLASGGVVWLARKVNRVIIKDGEARGIELIDGTRIGATKFVVSSIDPPGTFLNLVGADHLDSNFVTRIKQYEFYPWTTFAVHAGLNEPPKYTASKAEPMLNDAFHMIVGYEDTKTVWEHYEDSIQGRLPKVPAFDVMIPSLFDPTQAPPGKHTLLMWQFVPRVLKDKSLEEWDDIRMDFMQKCLERLRDYAPNMTEENIVHSFPFSPHDIGKHITNLWDGALGGALIASQVRDKRPFPECFSYRTPIKKLYLTGSGTHPHGNVNGGPGYNSAKVIAEDLGLGLWWSPPDLKKIWSSLDS